jgi:hypothetical protein
MLRVMTDSWWGTRSSSAKSSGSASTISVVLDEEVDLARVGQQVFEIGDTLHDHRVLVQQLLALQPREATKLHVEDRPRLHLGEVEGVAAV